MGEALALDGDHAGLEPGTLTVTGKNDEVRLVVWCNCGTMVMPAGGRPLPRPAPSCSAPPGVPHHQQHGAGRRRARRGGEPSPFVALMDPRRRCNGAAGEFMIFGTPSSLRPRPGGNCVWCRRGRQTSGAVRQTRGIQSLEAMYWYLEAMPQPPAWLPGSSRRSASEHQREAVMIRARARRRKPPSSAPGSMTERRASSLIIASYGDIFTCRWPTSTSRPASRLLSWNWAILDAPAIGVLGQQLETIQGNT